MNICWKGRPIDTLDADELRRAVAEHMAGEPHRPLADGFALVLGAFWAGAGLALVALLPSLLG